MPNVRVSHENLRAVRIPHKRLCGASKISRLGLSP